LKVNIVSAGWVDDDANGNGAQSGFAPALAFSLTNVGDVRTGALEVNAVFHRPEDEGGGPGLGTASAPAVGWRGLDPGTTSPAILLHGRGNSVRDLTWYALRVQPIAVPSERLERVHARVFVHHEGHWTLLGDFTVPAQRMTR